LAELDWYSLDGSIAYQVLATNRFHLVADDIRKDVSEGFKRLKETADKKLKASMGAAADSLIRKWEEGGLNRFIASRFLRAAVQGIAAHSTATDIGPARDWLNAKDREIPDGALEIISRYGDTSDVDSLIRCANERSGRTAAKAASVAIKLASNPVEVANRILKTNSSVVAFRWLLDQPIAETKQLFHFFLAATDFPVLFRFHVPSIQEAPNYWEYTYPDFALSHCYWLQQNHKMFFWTEFRLRPDSFAPEFIRI
jgi:hypothetical protein